MLIFCLVRKATGQLLRRHGSAKNKALSNPKCKNICVLEYDFYCILIHKNKLIQFVIEYDGNFHYVQSNFVNFEEYHKRDVIKQYYLHEMNVHLLRLIGRFNTDMIECFIDKLLDCQYYVAINKIKPIKKYFLNNDIHKGLVYFGNYFNCIDCNVNKSVSKYSNQNPSKKRKLKILCI
ncbi:hypothetical protein QJ857_gp0406 [Tupanvirus soda lake]|uniref:DUF5889 domain-containing protein n=2 Tax=Tupanvirus TaxID=2094720 RepID=A0A6N1NWE0_9VIRU|nr:hypothetical protein QJ857_gp0406 [Tupanvirus soda lake]QKU35628.1 hypothetical protein [Tupanvirus soda lake]